MYEKMFKSQVRLIGKHALIMQKLCKDKSLEQEYKFIVIDNPDGVYIFNRRVDCYMTAAMLGIVNQRTAEEDHDKTYKDVDVSIFVDVLEKERPNLERIYEHMIFAENDGLTPEEKVKKAFSYGNSEDWKIEQNRFDDYVRGGLEILDECFMSCDSYESICNKIIDLVRANS